MKPLYLQGKTGMRVELDSPALSIISPDKTRQLFPLSRVSRVIVFGGVDWSMSALFACADAGISIVFLNKIGAIRCHWLTASIRPQGSVHLFADLFERRGALLSYQNWSVAMQRMALRSSARRLGFSDWKDAKKQNLDNWAKDTLADGWLPVQNVLQGFLLSSVLNYLTDLGLDANCKHLAKGNINLATDLSQILLWDFYPFLYTWSKGSSIIPNQVCIVKLYEGRSQRIEHLLHGLLNRLHQCLSGNV